MKLGQYTTTSVEAVLQQWNVVAGVGLSADQITAARQRYGSNVLAEHPVTGWSILIRQFQSSFVYLLVGAAVLAIVLGEMIDGAMIIIFVAVNALLGFLQEFRSEKTSQLLKQYTVLHTIVRRDGTEQTIANQAIVPGDIVVLEAGDIIPADCRVVKAMDLTVNETVLTGESVPVTKSEAVLSQPTEEIYQASNILFSGTHVVSGEVEAVVLATGKETAMGSLATLATETKRISTFEVEINKFSKFILRLVVITLLAVLVMHLFLKGATDWVDLVIFAIALAVGVIPEGLPVVTTFSLSRGALRLSKQKVVVKRLTAIEDLGGIEVLCTDKTGTITENKLTVVDVVGSDKTEILKTAAWACAEVVHDPFDIAIQAASGVTAPQRVTEIPFDPERRRNSVLVNGTLIVRGAPEVICGFCPLMKEADCAALEQWVAEQGVQGRRVLAVARKTWPGSEYTVEDELTGLEFLGSIAFEDPIKESTAQAVLDAQELGVTVKVITGDSIEVATAVAKQVHLVTAADQVMLGHDLLALPHEDQLQAVMSHHVFARVSPEQKFHIIDLLQQQQLQVGFLGEGINDAPALKKANISLVVQSASDIARESADVILLEQSLEVVVYGIREGRAVFANTMKYIQATLSSNFGNFYAVALVSLFIDFLPMLPLQILLVNLLSDFPMISIAADRVDPAEQHKPKAYHVKDILLLATFLGITSTVFDFIFFAVFRHLPPSGLQTNWFIGSIITELLFLFSIRTRRLFFLGTKPAPIILLLSIVAAALTVAIPFTSIGHTIFQFTSPSVSQLVTIAVIALAYLITTETVKLLYFKTRLSNAS